MIPFQLKWSEACQNVYEEQVADQYSDKKQMVFLKFFFGLFNFA